MRGCNLKLALVLGLLGLIVHAACASGNPIWWGSKVGISNEVLAPWTPMTATSSSATCWGRTYHFNQSPFPSQITNQGADILYAPISLNAVVNGSAVTWQSRYCNVVERKDNRVTVKTENYSGGTIMTGVVTIEYDGLVRVDVSLIGDRASTINSLTLEIPIKKQYATLFAAQPEDSFMQGDWPHWGGGRNGFVPTSTATGPFTSYFWIGTDYGGLIWVAESQKNWANSNQERVIQIVPHSDYVSLVVKVVDYAVPFDKKLDLTFGLQATPVKIAAERKRFAGCGYETVNQTDAYETNKGKLSYWASGNINPGRGRLRLWTRVNFNPATSNSDEKIFNLRFPNYDDFGLYWNESGKGLRAYVYRDLGTTRQADITANCSGWTNGERHLITLSWGDELAIYDGDTKLASTPFSGTINSDITNAVIELTGKFFVIDAVKIDNGADTDAGMLLWDTFTGWENPSTTIPEKSADGGHGVLTGSFFTGIGQNGQEITFGGQRTVIPKLTYLKQTGVDILHFHEQWPNFYNYPILDSNYAAMMTNLVTSAHAAGLKVQLYLGSQIADNVPEFSTCRDDIVTMPWAQGVGWDPPAQDGMAYGCSYAGLWGDFMAYYLEKLLRDFDFDGFYMDGTQFPPKDKNIRTGAGYYDRNGILQASQQIYRCRDFIKRLRTIADNIKPGFRIDIHESEPMWCPTASFGDSIWNGEQYTALSQRNGLTIRSILPLDTFRATFNGVPYGYTEDMLAYYDMSSSVAMALVHNVDVRGMPKEIYDARTAFGTSSATWYPYFENSQYVTASDPNVKVSFYRKADKSLLLAVSNFGGSSVDATITLNTTNLTLPTNPVARDVLIGRPLTIQTNAVQVHLEPWVLHYVSITPG